MRMRDWSSDVCSSDLQALGRIERDSVKGRSARHTERWDRLRDEQRADREKRKDKPAAQRKSAESAKPSGLAERIADRALSAASFMDRWVTSLLERSSHRGDDREDGHAAPTAPQPALEPSDAASQDHGGGHDR